MLTGAERGRSAGDRPERGCAGVGGAAACTQGRCVVAAQALLTYMHYGQVHYGLGALWRSSPSQSCQ